MTTTGFTLTGRHVLAILFLFFGTVFSVNFYMARAAIQTFSGLEADKPYQEGLKYNDVIAAAREQAERHWKVDAKVEPQTNGVLLVVTQREHARAILAEVEHDLDQVDAVGQGVEEPEVWEGRRSASSPKRTQTPQRPPHSELRAPPW